MEYALVSGTGGTESSVPIWESIRLVILGLGFNPTEILFSV